MILACNHIDKSYGEKNVLSDVTFHINEHEKVALIGINGAGKTTLLRIIIGESLPTSGEVILKKGASIGYLPQLPEFSSNKTIYEELLTVKEDIIKLDADIREMEKKLSSLEGTQLEQALNRYGDLTHEFEERDGYAYKSRLTGVIRGLGFSEEDAKKNISSLSGGEKTRVALGKLLLSEPDVLLMDEPTNHLDMDSISWLETYLLNYSGSVLIVSHDRYFLDRIVTRVVEIDHSKSTTFEGNYSDYAIKKKALRDAMIKQYMNQQREIKHQEEVIEKLRSFNREKSIKRAESRVKMLDKIERLDKVQENASAIHFSLEPNICSGNDVLHVENLAKHYGSRTLFSNVTFDIQREERVAIIGNNGTGKTTLLKMIKELIPIDEGFIRLGTNVYVGYYDQEHTDLSPEKNIFEEIQDDYPDLTHTRIRNVLASFLFTGDDVFKLIGDLSGGEKGRVLLAKLMLSEANFLLLDEPTNHLDITSKEILENVLNNYKGTILFVSHDRYFINQTATRILDLDNGSFHNYIGNYDYYLEKHTEEQLVIANNETVSETKNDWEKQKEEKAVRRKWENQMAAVEQEIAKLEQTIAEAVEGLLLPENATNVAVLIDLQKTKEEAEQLLLQKMEEWEELSNQF